MLATDAAAIVRFRKAIAVLSPALRANLERQIAEPALASLRSR
jgi:hypothetical protein